MKENRLLVWLGLGLMGFRGNGKFPGGGALTTEGDPKEQEATGAIRSRGPPVGGRREGRGGKGGGGGGGKSLGPNSLSAHAMDSGEAGSWV